MQLEDKTYKEINRLFKFTCNPVEKYGTVEKAEENLKKWGKSNLLIPSENHADWYRLAVDALKLGKRVVIVTAFNPHYKYWFKWVWLYSSKIILYRKHVIRFKGYDNFSPKDICLILFDPEQRKSPRKNLYHNYVGDKYEYFRLPLKVRKEDVDVSSDEK